ncbi:transglutaminaseTgpA domain-containing protein [Dactylosporangium sp. CA-092794]|uniref:transglutaminaseTgpA domain-containing protein n=1 Tax=Dactylosporangium sp. CA-092794 TaxID=3239929 RepID=UPI003D933EFD
MTRPAPLAGPHATLSAGLQAALLAVAAGAAGRVYDGPLLAVLVAGAAAGSAGIGRLLLGRPQWTVAPVSVAALLGYTAVAVWWTARSSATAGPLPALLFDALASGGSRVLSAAVPVEARPDTVALPVVLVWVHGLIGTELALRAGRVAVALVPPAVVYAAALVLAGPHGGPQPWRAVAFVVLAAVALAAPAVRLAADLAPVGGCVAAAAVVVVAVSLGLPYRPPDPRGLVEPPSSDVLDDENPLARISGWMQNQEQPLLDVVGGSAPLTLAVLDDFDGVVWRIDARYQDAGRVLPEPELPADAVAPAGPTLAERITIRQLGGRLVPAVSVPRRIDGIRVAFDERGGTLLRMDGPIDGASYAVTSQVPRPDRARLAAAGVPSGPAVARLLDAGGNVPPDLSALAQSIAETNGAAYQRATALQQYLASHYRFVTDAPSGHAYPNLRFFLLGDPGRGGGRGTSEQFAAAYAVLGRLMGLPTRVVVGFTVPAGGGTVRGADALAWPEVLFSGVGWVAFDPLPPAGTQPLSVPQDLRPSPSPSPSRAPSPTPSAARSPTPPAPPAISGPAARPADTGGRAASPSWPWLAAGLLLGIPLAVAGARRAQTGRRLRAGPAPARVRGAWLEVLDALRLAGLPPAGHLPATAVPPRSLDGGSLPSVAGLAELVNADAFAPGGLDEQDPAAAGAVWQALRYTAALRRGGPWWRRASWPVHPGPLLWRHGLLRRALRRGVRRE